MGDGVQREGVPKPARHSKDCSRWASPELSHDCEPLGPRYPWTAGGENEYAARPLSTIWPVPCAGTCRPSLCSTGGLHSGAVPLSSTCCFEATPSVSETTGTLPVRTIGPVLDVAKAGRHKSRSVEPAACSRSLELACDKSRNSAARCDPAWHVASQRGRLSQRGTAR